MSADYKTILTELKNGILTLTLNRPEKLNAFNMRMRTEVVDFFRRVNSDDDVRVIVVTGSGRAFCAGADLSSGSETFNYSKRAESKNQPHSPDNASHPLDVSVGGVHRDGGGVASLAIFECLKPVISAVNGPAVGVGVTMQLPMDIRIASENARFGFVFTKRGVTPEACSSWFLPRLVGTSQALEWMLSARIFDANEALRGGLVKAVVPHDDLLPEALSLAEEIARDTSPVSVAMTRAMLWRLPAQPHPMHAHIIESRAIVSRGSSADAQEGVSSFLEKRPPKFPLNVSKDMPDFHPWDAPPKFL